MSIYILVHPLSQFISSLAWFHNGTKLASNNRVKITNDGTSLTILDLEESDKGIYEVKIYKIEYEGNSDLTTCDINLLPLLESYAIHTPVTFLLQDSNIPSYEPRDAILYFSVPLSQNSNLIKNIDIDNILPHNPVELLLASAGIPHNLYKDGVLVENLNIYTKTLSFYNGTRQSLKITYENSEDIIGNYIQQAFDLHVYIRETICPGYYKYISRLTFFPVSVLYWNIRSYRKLTNVCLYHHSGHTYVWISLKLGMITGSDPTLNIT